MILLYNILKRRTEGVLPGLMCWIDYILKVSSCSVSGPPGLFCAILSRPSIWQVKVVLCRGVKHRTSHRQFVISPHCTTGQTICLVCSWMSSVVDLWRVRVAEGLERVLPRCKFFFFLFLRYSEMNTWISPRHEITHSWWVNSKAWLGGESWRSHNKKVWHWQSHGASAAGALCFSSQKITWLKVMFHSNHTHTKKALYI